MSRSRGESNAAIRTIKCVIVGDDDVGKSTLVKRWITGAKVNPEDVPRLVHEKNATITIDDKIVQILMWDTIGNPDHDRIRPLGYYDADVFAVLFSMVNQKSLNNVSNLWHPEIRHIVPGAKILLIGTKCDLSKHSTNIPMEDIEEVKKEIGAFEFVQCSAVTGENVDGLLHLIYKAYKSKPKKFTMKKVVGFFSRDKKKANSVSKYKTNETSRDYDIIVFGATGFTGQLVCEYFAKSTPENFKWAIAGRGKEKLESIRTNLTKINPSLEKLELIIADVKDQESIDAMVRSTKVLIDVAGPFTYYGPPVIDACIRFSTDYCDITGEIPYVMENMEKYHKIAQEKGIHIVSCCGYDSIPSDLGCLFVVNHIKEKYNRKTSYAKGFVGDFKGGPSGGTVASGLAVSKHSRKKDWINNPCCLNDPERKGVANVRSSSLFSYDRDFGWKGPNIMANINDRIVRRSDSILNYGDNFWYTENSGFKSFFKGIISSVVMWIIMGVLDSSLLRKFASLVLPKPGEGPSRQIIETGYWNYYLVGVSQKEGTEKRHRVTAHLSYNKDPGYGSTSIMLAESGLCLALQKNELPLKGGVLTPASSMGTLLIQRLQKVGFTFKIQKEEEI